MERLLDLSRKVSDHAEVYRLDEKCTTVTFENAKLKAIDTTIHSGVSLRVIRDGKLGFSFTKNLGGGEELVKNAEETLLGGAEAPAGFPNPSKVPAVDALDPAIDAVTSERIVRECRRVCTRLRTETNGQINLEAGLRRRAIGLMNTGGVHLNTHTSEFFVTVSVLFPGSYASISRRFSAKGFKETPTEILEHVLRLYRAGEKPVRPHPGEMKVLFLPETVYALMWRLRSATNGKTIFQGESPLEDRMGAQVLDEKLTIMDDPLDDTRPGARAFDDEGTPCAPLGLIEKGVLRNTYTDLFYAGKLRKSPTGHGYKTAMWGGDPVSLKPVPSLQHLSVRPGGAALDAMIGSMDRGIIAAQVLGAHSGNIINGDFSMGLSPGLYAEDGSIRGHVKDVMVSGNIYDTLGAVVLLEDTNHPCEDGRYPGILVDGVGVVIGGS